MAAVRLTPIARDEMLDRGEPLAGVRYERRASSVVLRFDTPWRTLSSAVLGGGRRDARSVLHLQVPLTYRGARPERDLRAAARALDLDGPLVGLMTAVDLTRTQIFAGIATGVAVRALVTVGLGNASRPGERHVELPVDPGPGTINAIVLCEGRLRDAAAVELALVLAEAKAAALVESGVLTSAGSRASGTSTDAVAVLWRGTSGPAVRHAGAATELGAFAGSAMSAAIASELARRAGAGTEPRP